MDTYMSEKLNLWDRFFNRYKLVFIERKTERWFQTYDSIRIPNSEFKKEFVIYHKVDRLTGAFEIVKKYLN